jgi:hypothetical protein
MDQEDLFAKNYEKTMSAYFAKPAVHTVGATESPQELVGLRWSPRQIFQIDPTQSNLLVGRRGLRIFLPPGAFCDEAGRTITQSFELVLQEIDSKPGILLAGQSTVSRDQAFECGGMICLEAFKQPKWRLQRPLTLEWPLYLPLPKHAPLRLLNYGPARTRAMAHNEGWEWLPMEQQASYVKWHKKMATIQFEASELGWYACQKLNPLSGMKSLMSASLDTPELDFERKIAFLVLRDLHTVIRMYEHGTKFAAFNLPLRKPGSIVALAEKGESLYLGVQSFTGREAVLPPIKLLPIDRKWAPQWLFKELE